MESVLKKPFVVGNWKMNGSLDHVHRFQAHLEPTLKVLQDRLSLGICPPFPFLTAFSENFLSHICLGGQDCSTQAKGAFTGDISAAMLKDVGCSFVLLGHSERRYYHQETSEILKQKYLQAVHANLQVILCVGETLAQRQEGTHLETVAKQIHEVLKGEEAPAALWIAYEPVWAIGTKEVPSSEAVQEMVVCIQQTYRHLFPKMSVPVPILYGGSVGAENVASFLNISGIEGVLVGGASLQPETFEALLKAY